MLIPDHEIRRLCRQKSLVMPYVEANLNPASIDVTLGSQIMVEAEDSREFVKVDLLGFSEEDPYFIEPGELFLAETAEIFNLPDYLGAQFVLKSSRAREGFDHLEAGYADPGWYGSRLTMELKNARRFHSLPIWPGLRIGQMKFIMVSGTVESSYAKTGRYNCDLGVMASKG